MKAEVVKMQRGKKCWACGSGTPVNSVGVCIYCTMSARLAAGPQKEPATIGDWLFGGVMLIVIGAVVGLAVWTFFG